MTTASLPPFVIRPATAADVPLILALIRELAEFERLLPDVVADETLLRTHLFGARPAAEVLLGFEADGEPMGFALFFQNFSTFLAASGHLPGRPVRAARQAWAWPGSGAVDLAWPGWRWSAAAGGWTGPC